RKLPVGGVQVGRRAQAAEPRFVRGVSCIEVEDEVRLGQRAALVDELRSHTAQAVYPRIVDETGHGQPALLLVRGALLAGEDRRGRRLHAGQRTKPWAGRVADARS